LFDPCLKEGKPIIVDDEAPEYILYVTSKDTITIKYLKDIPMKKTRGVKRQKVLSVVEISKSYDKAEHEHSLSSLIPEITYSSLDKETFPPPTLIEEEEAIEFQFTEVERLEEMPRKHNISIHLNKSSSEEDPWEDRAEIGKTSKKEKTW